MLPDIGMITYLAYIVKLLLYCITDIPAEVIEQLERKLEEANTILEEEVSQ